MSESLNSAIDKLADDKDIQPSRTMKEAVIFLRDNPIMNRAVEVMLGASDEDFAEVCEAIGIIKAQLIIDAINETGPALEAFAEWPKLPLLIDRICSANG